MVSAIEVRDLRKSYGSVEALKGLTFTVREGEIYGLIGPNGAGKTTTLKILVGLLRPDAGVAKVLGHDVVRERIEALKYVGYVPENPVAFHNLSIEEFVRFVTSLRGIEWGSVRGVFEYYLDAFNLRSKRGELMGRLSRGMVQKALVIAALTVKPRVLIMDEPMAGMDPEAQYVFKEEVRRLVREDGVTVLISSHLLDMVEKFCDRVGIINEGRLVLEGSVEEVKEGLGGSKSLEEVFLKVVKGRA